MQADAVTRGLLGLILLCLAILVVAELAGEPHAGERLVALGSDASALIRVDLESGEAWKLERLGGENRWIPFPLPDGPSAAGAGGAANVSGRSPAASAAAPAEPPPTAEEIQLLVDSLLESDLPADVRVWTAQQLGAIRGDAATEALISALADPEPPVVVAAAQALAQRSDPRIAPALAKLRDHPDPSVQGAARSTRIETLD